MDFTGGAACSTQRVQSSTLRSFARDCGVAAGVGEVLPKCCLVLIFGGWYQVICSDNEFSLSMLFCWIERGSCKVAGKLAINHYAMGKYQRAWAGTGKPLGDMQTSVLILMHITRQERRWAKNPRLRKPKRSVGAENSLTWRPNRFHLSEPKGTTNQPKDQIIKCELPVCYLAKYDENSTTSFYDHNYCKTPLFDNPCHLQPMPGLHSWELLTARGDHDGRSNVMNESVCFMVTICYHLIMDYELKTEIYVFMVMLTYITTYIKVINHIWSFRAWAGLSGVVVLQRASFSGDMDDKHQKQTRMMVGHKVTCYILL